MEHRRHIWIIAAMNAGLFLGPVAVAQVSTDPNAAHPSTSVPSAGAVPKLERDLVKLQQQVKQLEQKLSAAQPSMTQPMAPSSMPMESDDDMPMGNGSMTSSAAPMPTGGMGMMRKMHGMKNQSGSSMGMDAMGGMNSASAMATPSALPGFPGQSHLYHIGASDFFLDHPEHIALTTQQQKQLGQQKQKALSRQGELQREIDAADEELWELTGADEPQINAIEKKVREIEGLRADKRIAFIRAVGDAAKVLTVEQRQQLTGLAPAQPASSQPMQMPSGDKPKDSMGHM